MIIADDFRSILQERFAFFVEKTFGHLSDRAKKHVTHKLLTLEHYTCNKGFVSDEAQYWLFLQMFYSGLSSRRKLV